MLNFTPSFTEFGLIWLLLGILAIIFNICSAWVEGEGLRLHELILYIMFDLVLGPVAALLWIFVLVAMLIVNFARRFDNPVIIKRRKN